MSRPFEKRFLINTATVTIFAVGGFVFAEPPGGPPTPPTAAKPAEEKPDFPKFEEVCKGFEKVKPSGVEDSCFLTLWYNKKTDQLFAQIPQSLVGKKFLIAVSVSGGPSATGFQIDHWLAYLERMDKNLVLMRVDPRYAADDGAPVADVVKRSYTDEIAKVIPIRTLQGADPIVDLGELFKGDFAGIAPFLGGMANAGLSKWGSWKTFPNNTELNVEMAVTGRRGPGAGDDSGTMGRRIQMHYSLSSLPQTDYKPRVADNRVGYFMTVRYDWAKKYDAKTLFNRYINRWNLKKSDDSLDIAPPVKPITWFVEKTVPIRWRRYVTDGIGEWNKAFEKCGLVNAVQVLQQTDKEYADLDPEDVRYNFFRWIVTGNSFAMGPSRDHPLTGEILDADIVFDDSMVRFYVQEYERMTGTAAAWDPMDPFLNDFLRTHPRWGFSTAWEKLMPNVRLKVDSREQFNNALSKRMAQHGRPLCDYAAGMGHQLALARIQLEAKGMTPQQNEEFLGQVVKEVVMHEVGHCLGLRHNFKSSTWKSLEEMESASAANEPTVGSVMDYNPNLFAVRGEKQGSYIPRTIGPYDYWAIEYGYRVPGKDDKGEDEMLKKIAGRCAEPGLDYSTDEDTFGVLSADPLSNRFDAGKDPIAYAEAQIKLVDSLMKDITTWAIKDGESYNRLRRTFTRLATEKSRACGFVARMVGGQIMNRDQKGDPNARPPIQPVEAEKQKAARDFVIKNVFAADAYQFDPALLNQLAPGRFWHWDSDEFDLQQEFNIHDLVAASQYRCLFNMMNPFTLIRIHDGEQKFPKDASAYTLDDHIQTLTDSIWSELDDPKGGAKEAINSYRRNLQRMHLRMLTELVLSGEDDGLPADAGSIARQAASNLSEKIGKKLKAGNLGPETQAHLTDSKKRIDKALEAEYMIGARGAGGGQGVMFFRPAGEAQSNDSVIEVLPQR